MDEESMEEGIPWLSLASPGPCANLEIAQIDSETRLALSD